MNRWIVFFSLICLAGPLSATHPLSILPAAPTASDPIQATIELGGSGTATYCRTMTENLDGVTHHSSLVGSTVFLDIVMIPDGQVCTPVLPGLPHSFALGALAVGSYTLIVSEVGPDTSFPVTAKERTELASMIFGVASVPTAVPVNRPLALAMLAGLLLLSGGLFRRRLETTRI